MPKISIIQKLDASIKIIIFEPFVKESHIIGCDVYPSLINFLELSNIILANRIEEPLVPFQEKVFTRDIFGEN